MREPLPDTLLSQLSELVAAQIGLRFPVERWRDLERGIGSAAREFGFKDAESCIRRLLSSPLSRSQIEILARHLTVGETYFFRDKRLFEMLEQRILPELIQRRRPAEKRLRIWSAGCCTGEEPYSLAMVLNQLIPDLKDWNITLLATDIHPGFLRKASEGVYTEWSFRDTPPWIKQKYFQREKGGRFEIVPFLKKMVTFSYLNLAEDIYPSLTNNTNAMDIIFCRNVLMYFDKARARKAVQNFFHALLEGGWLIVSPSEASTVLFSQFVTVNDPGLILYQKEGHPLQKVDVFTIGLPEEQRLSQPDIDFTAERAAPLLPETETSFHPEVETPKTAEPQPTLYIEASALYEQGRYGDAADKIQGWLLRCPEDARAMALLARIHANQGSLTEALAWCKKAIAAEKLNPGHRYLCATILQEQALIEEAILSLKRALYLDPHFVLAHFALGNLAQRQGDFGESEKHFRNTLSLLSALRKDEILPESEGITAGRLLEVLKSKIGQEASA